MIVLIADDHPSSVFVTRQLVQDLPGGEHEAEAVHDSEALLRRLGAGVEDLDLIMLDLTMPGDLKRLPLIRQVRELAPSVPVVVYSAEDEPLFVESALDLDIAGYVPKASSLKNLREAMELAVKGQRYVDPSIDLSAAADHPWKALTPAEREVVLALAKGQNLRSLALETGRAYTTIANHKYAALQKLEVANSEISSWLVTSGLLFLLDS